MPGLPELTRHGNGFRLTGRSIDILGRYVVGLGVNIPSFSGRSARKGSNKGTKSAQRPSCFRDDLKELNELKPS